MFSAVVHVHDNSRFDQISMNHVTNESRAKGNESADDEGAKKFLSLKESGEDPEIAEVKSNDRWEECKQEHVFDSIDDSGCLVN
jgi:hypothetical protein